VDESIARMQGGLGATFEDRARLEALWLRRSELMQSSILRKLEALKTSRNAG
jgi:hypothetical protein